MLSRVCTSEIGKLNDTLYELGIEKIGEGSSPPEAYQQLNNTPAELGINRFVERSTPLDAYQHLCRWKTDKVHDDQADILRKALDKSSYEGAWEEICGNYILISTFDMLLCQQIARQNCTKKKIF